MKFFSSENEIFSAIGFYDHTLGPDLLTKCDFIEPTDKQLLLFKAYQAKNNVVVIQYIKRYNGSISLDKKQQMIKEIKDYLSESVFVADFEGKERRPDNEAEAITLPDL